MTNTLKAMLAATAVTAALVMSACAQAGAPASASAEAMGLAANPYQLAGQEKGMGRHGGFPQLLAKRLNLTAEQQAAFKAIAEKHRAALKPAAMAEHHATLKTLLLADQVDTAALRSFIEARQAEMSTKRPAFAAMLGEFRAVLTDAQRQQLVDTLAQAPAAHEARKGGWGHDGMQKMMIDRVTGDLALTAAQRTALDALVAKVRGLHGAGDMQAKKQAFTAFVQTGDTAALAAVSSPVWPTDELVGLATSLDKAQREKLVAKAERFKGHMGKGRGGWGHH